MEWGWWYSSLSVDPGNDGWWDADVVLGTAEEFSPNGFASELSQRNSSCSTTTFAVGPDFLAKYDSPGPPAVGNFQTPSNYCDFMRYWSNHSGGAQWAFADGSVRFIPYSSTRNMRMLIRAIGTKNGSNKPTINEAGLDFSTIE